MEELEELEELEVLEPEDGDYVMYDTGPLGSRTGVSIYQGKHIGVYDSFLEAEGAIVEDMDKERFWPNVWYMDDHGGYSLRGVSVDKEVVAI